ncbi:hypothetical protein F4818DRAFT_120559 [Hypoxylon cercidicola]|nr:hypothetical protein F4818DRAFT_120559 [Hypoxylon cercidicola]
MGAKSNPDNDDAVPARSSQDVEDDGLYYIYASSSGQTSGGNIDVLTKGISTDTFVSSLNEEQVIILESTPSVTAATSLASTDKTLLWFQELDPAAAGSVTIDSEKAIKSFSLEFQQPWTMTFRSDSEVLLHTFGPPSAGADYRIPPPGIDEDGQILTLGLDFNAAIDVTSSNTLRDLYGLVGSASMADYLPDGLLDLVVALQPPEGDLEPKRNALWYIPTSSKRISMRLQFQVPVFDLLQDILGTTLPGFTIKTADIIFSQDVLLAATEAGPQQIFQGSIAFRVQSAIHRDGADDIPMTAAIDISESSITITALFESKDDPLSGIVEWLASLIGDNTLGTFVNDILHKDENGKLFSNFVLRRMLVGIDTRDPTNRKLSSFSFDIEVSTGHIGGGSDSNPVVFSLSYNWSRLTGGFGELAGQLWTTSRSWSDIDLLPNQEKWTVLRPVTTDHPAQSINIASLIPGQTVESIPDTLPSEITTAYISLTQESFSIRCSFKAKHGSASSNSVPQPYLDEIALESSFNWGNSGMFALGLYVNAGIDPSEEAAANGVRPAILKGLLTYDSSVKEWKLDAKLTGLYAATLVEFFKDEEKDHIGPLINSIVISSLDVQYTYTGASESGNSASTGTKFVISGDLVIASLRLKLDFTYDEGGFTFTASLNSAQASATIGDVLTSILGTTDIDLPDFVYNTQLGSGDKDFFNIKISKQENSYLFVSQLAVTIADLTNVIDFAQMHRTESSAKTPSKRLFRVSISGFPNREIDLPLIGKLTQPLDELYFLWAQDPTPPKANKMNGLTRSDLAEFNGGLDDPIIVKDKIKPDAQSPEDLMVAAGCHFAIIIRSSTGERSCLLDYEFMKPSASSSSNSTALSLKEGGDREEPGDDGSPSAQAPYKKTAGPLSISNVGLKYKDKQLAITFTATFELGPLGFSLVGFSLGLNIKTLNDGNPKITPNIEGLSASFEQSPLSITGVIRHGNTGGTDYFAGGLVVGWKPYQFEAAGFYGLVKQPDPGEDFTSIFIFAKLNGPLVTLEFAEINSLCGGFGYNSNVRMPTVDEVYEFPFIANTGLSGSQNARDVLEKLVDPSSGGWFQALDNTYWLAVGLGVGAFQMLKIDAVVAVQFGSAIKIGIFAVATADIPTPDSPSKLAHVELGIAAVADFDYGTLKIDAQLSPRSFILDPNCHLTGGFGLYYWFDAPHADSSAVGQYVFTLGGYHQAYNKPVGFPDPPRLGISWDLGGGLTVSGQAYFAITPKACMAGGHLHAVFSAGPLEAWFDTFADFLINYKPFSFNMQAGVSVGVKYSIDIWFVHIRISVEIGAQLYLWGPPIAGRVHIDLWIVSFDINFGFSSSVSDTVKLIEFYHLVLQSQANNSSSSYAGVSAAGKRMLAITGGEDDDDDDEEEVDVDVIEALEDSSQPRKNEGHNFLAQSGLLNPADNPERNQNEDWIVRGGSFSFVVECKMAINAVKDGETEKPVIQYGDVYSKPMKLTSPMDSVLTVVIQHKEQDGNSTLDQGWGYDAYLKSLPQALWAKYDPKTDPRAQGNNIGELLHSANGAVTLMAGVLITAPKPTMAPDPFPAYDVADADLVELDAEKAFPTLADADAAWAPAKPLTGNGSGNGGGVQNQYDAVLRTWSVPPLGSDEEGRQGFVGALAAAFKWDLADGMARIVDEFKSKAGMPERLKSGFMDLYVAAPLLSQ